MDIISLLIFIFGLALRLWHITNPLLDEHHWRQTASGIVARNYMKNMNFFQPTQDIEQRYPMSFGFYEYTIGILGKAFGFSDILGRLVSLLMFL